MGIDDAGASINTPNIGNSALIIEELDWGGQDALNTCENSFFGSHLGLGRQKTWSDLDNPLMWSCHIYFRKFALFILESFLYLFYKVCFIYFRKFALFILESLLYLF